MSRILVVDDEPNLRHSVTYRLQQEGFETLAAADGEQGLELALSRRPDLVILDVMLPHMDGLEVCRRLRRESDVPVLMLTARDTEIDKVVGLEIGADDYLAKPFSMRELIARIRAMLRRAAKAPEISSPDVLDVSGLTIDPARHRVVVDGAEVTLKPREFDLLAYLARSPGKVFSREQLLAAVWGMDYAGDSRTVDTHMKTLREKLGDRADTPRWLETVRGVGYRMRDASPI